MTTPDRIAQEADRILELVDGHRLTAYQMIERQLGVLVLRTQVMLSLCGIVITVTGFSGRAIAQTSPLARYSIATGICVVLMAAIVAIWGVLRLQWLTQSIVSDTRAMLIRGLEIRYRKTRFLTAALVLFALGFAFYVLAIVQLLWAAAPPL